MSKKEIDDIKKRLQILELGMLLTSPTRNYIINPQPYLEMLGPDYISKIDGEVLTSLVWLIYFRDTETPTILIDRETGEESLVSNNEALKICLENKHSDRYISRKANKKDLERYEL